MNRPKADSSVELRPSSSETVANEPAKQKATLLSVRKRQDSYNPTAISSLVPWKMKTATSRHIHVFDLERTLDFMARFKVSVSPQPCQHCMLAFFKPWLTRYGKGGVTLFTLVWIWLLVWLIFFPHRRGIEYVLFCKVCSVLAFFFFGIKPMCSSTACLNPPLAWNLGHRACLFLYLLVRRSLCVTEWRRRLNKYLLGKTEDGIEEVSPIMVHRCVLHIEEGNWNNNTQKKSI